MNLILYICTIVERTNSNQAMAKNKNIKRQDYGLFRVATAIPTVKVADVEYNLKQHIQLLHEAHDEGVQLLVFPELSLTGYTCADLSSTIVLCSMLPFRLSCIWLRLPEASTWL